MYNRKTHNLQPIPKTEPSKEVKPSKEKGIHTRSQLEPELLYCKPQATKANTDYIYISNIEMLQLGC
mgnify:CR=1 FL=1